MLEAVPLAFEFVLRFGGRYLYVLSECLYERSEKRQNIS